MDFAFLDINAAMMGSIKGQAAGINGISQGTSDQAPQEFLNQLNRIVQQQRAQGQPETMVNRSGQSNATENLGEALGDEKGIAFLKRLKSMFLALSGGDMGNLSVNKEGLQALEQLLEKAGFDAASIQSLTDELRLSLDAGEKVTVSDFMDRLFQLPKAESEDIETTEALMPVSSVPHMYSILNTLGIPEEKISEIMAESSRGSSGFSLDKALEMLRQFEAESFSSGVNYTSGKENDSFLKMFESLGISAPAGTDTTELSLSSLISALEQKQASLSGQTGTLAGNPFWGEENPIGNTVTMPQFSVSTAQGAEEGSHQELFAKLFDGLETVSVADKAQAAAPTDMVTGQIRDQIKNDLMNPVKDVMAPIEGETQQAAGKIDPAALAAQMDSDGKAGSGMREMVEILGEKSSLSGKSGEDKKSFSDISQLAQGAEKSASTGIDNGAMMAAKAKKTFSSLPTHVTQQVSKNMVRAINQGENTLHIQLKPAELGRVFMTIDNTGDSMKVSIITENQSAKEILASNVNEIKTVLSSAGISLDEFEVDMSSNFRQSMADARNQGQSGGKKNGRQNKTDDNNDNEQPITLATPAMPNNGALHFVA